MENEELEMIGFARPFLTDTKFPKCFFNDENAQIEDAKFSVGVKQLKDMAEAGFYDYQIHRLAKDKPINSRYNPYAAVLRLTWNEIKNGWL